MMSTGNRHIRTGEIHTGQIHTGKTRESDVP